MIARHRRRLPLAATHLLAVLSMAPWMAAEESRHADNPSQSRAWEWTWEERIAARFHPAEQLDRWTALVAEDPQRAGEARQVIQGSRNPELFLPFELMDHLLHALFAPSEADRAFWRAEYRRRSEALELPVEFWSDLFDHSRTYALHYETATRLQKELASVDQTGRNEREARLDALSHPLCRSRFHVLQGMRARYGRNRFDQFLYSVVATNLLQVGEDSNAAALKWAEEGCE